MERDFLRHPTRSASQELTSGSHTLSTMGTIALGGIVVALVLDLVWRSQRRPAQARNQLGEAYVEHPTQVGHPDRAADQLGSYWP